MSLVHIGCRGARVLQGAVCDGMQVIACPLRPDGADFIWRLRGVCGLLALARSSIAASAVTLPRKRC